VEPVEILYEDEDILAVCKAAGTPAVPERWDRRIASAYEILKESRPGLYIVHRIDKETSGVLVFCKTESALRNLSSRFGANAGRSQPDDAGRGLRKTYHALLAGNPAWDTMVCEAPLEPDGDRRHRTIVAPDGKACSTLFTVLERFGSYSLAGVCPATGRTHQIRAHAAHLGHAVLCDSLYGSSRPFLLSSVKRGYRPPAEGEKPLLSRLALHAAVLEFPHPASGKPLRLEAPLPKDMRSALAQLRKTVNHKPEQREQV
jgi:23S rRNA pseudouridine955/2504/2580 synthase/23S rRNA pseudouridine1911/1915/1917 synthase